MSAERIRPLSLKERSVLEALDALLRLEEVRAHIHPIVRRVAQTLAQDRTALMAWEPIPLGIYGDGDEQLANVVVDPIKDRHGRSILQVRDQNTFAEKLRQKRLMTLIHLWLVNRFKADAVIYVTPTEDNLYQTSKMKSHGIFSEVYQEVGEIIVADVDKPRIEELLKPDRVALRKLITKEG